MEKFIDKVKENSKFYSINFLNANKMPSSKNVIPFKAKEIKAESTFYNNMEFRCYPYHKNISQIFGNFKNYKKKYI